MIFKTLRRVYSYGSMNNIPNFDTIFPELKDISKEELYRRFADANIEFFVTKREPVSFLMRLTFPLALIVMLLMIIFMPINYLITGDFKYDEDKFPQLWNWFEKIGINK